VLILWLALMSTQAGEVPPASATPRAFAEEVTVTASRRAEAVADTPAAVTVLTAGELAATAAPTVDEALRQAPGFALFRRAGSRTANPTTLGATLRGLGGSGASRAAVLDDGVPLNDPFGGWIHWGRVPLTALERIEVLRGGASSLYGAGALAGVVQLVRRGGTGPRLDADASIGSMRSRQAAVFAAASLREWTARATGEVFDTAGYTAVRAQERGPVDTPVASRHLNLDLTLERGFAGTARAFVRGALYDDERRNGTPLQVNDTALWQGAAGWDGAAFGGALIARGHVGHTDYRQDFSAIDAPRRSERLTRRQQVPADTRGVAAHWTRPLGAHLVLVGLETRDVRGASEEELVTAPGSPQLVARGRQRAWSAFAEEAWSPSPRWLVSLGARWDAWRNFDAEQASAAGAVALPARSESALSPRLSVRHRPASWLAVNGSAYGAFRAPTLNELYRTFRVGNVETLANAALGAERLRGAEMGALAASARVSSRLTVFLMDVDDTIANVTLAVTPALVTRQRQNLGRIRSRGAELEVEARPWARWTLAGTWMLADATVGSFPDAPALEGRRLAQVPRGQAGLQVRYEGRRMRVSAQARWSAAQFEDDLNELTLAPARTVDLAARYVVAPAWEAYAAVENALDAAVQVGRTPVVTLGPPRTVRVGVRLRLGTAHGTTVALR
jgi:outer membrane receptor protein involved in Fe transport